MIAVSYLKSKFNKTETLKKIDDSLCDLIHVDLMDGLYVENKNFIVEEVLNDLKGVKKPLDIHLMVNNPEKYISELAKLKPYQITFHLNTSKNVIELIDLIKDYNIKVGIALNPNEDVVLLKDYLNLIDYVLIMSVYPGKGGQSFIDNVLEKVPLLQSVSIGLDGGINEESIYKLKKYKFDIIVSGSFVCMSDDYNKQIKLLKEIINNGL